MYSNKYLLCISFIVLQCTEIQLQAMNTPTRFIQQASRLNLTQFQALACYSQHYLQRYADKLACQKNESGFLRINIPLSTEIKSQFKDIKKLRTNYWAPHSGITAIPESIHTHPSYFESCIIDGGYNHEIYDYDDEYDNQHINDNQKTYYDLYHILKSGDKKSVAFMGNTSLKYIKNEFVGSNSIKVIDTSVIHRVMESKPETLSLNVIFDEESNSNKFYNLYLSKDGNLSDIKTVRDLLPNRESHTYIHQIITKLAAFQNSSANR